MSDSTMQKPSSNGYNPNGKIEIRGRTGFTTLDTGLKVITFNSDALKTIGIAFGVNYGNIHSLQKTDIIEIPHVLEHMMYQGTQHKKSLELLDCLEDFCVHNNAETLSESTIFHITVNKEREAREKAVKLLAEIMMEPVIPKDRLPNTHDVVMAETNERLDCAEARLSVDIVKELFKDHSLLRKSRIPDEREVYGISQEMLQEECRANYTASNSVLTLVSAMPHHKMVELVERNFANFDGKSDVQEIEPASTDHQYRELVIPNYTIKSPKQSTIDLSLKLPHFGPGANQTEDVTSNIARSILYLRIFKSLREETGLAYSPDVEEEKGSFFGMLSVTTKTAHDKIKQVKDLIIKELASMSSGDIAYEEFRKHQKREYIKANVNIEDNLQIATSIAALYLQHPDPFYWEGSEKLIKQVSIDQLREFCGKYLNPEKALVTMLVPH